MASNDLATEHYWLTDEAYISEYDVSGGFHYEHKIPHRQRSLKLIYLAPFGAPEMKASEKVCLGGLQVIHIKQKYKRQTKRDSNQVNKGLSNKKLIPNWAFHLVNVILVLSVAMVIVSFFVLLTDLSSGHLPTIAWTSMAIVAFSIIGVTSSKVKRSLTLASPFKARPIGNTFRRRNTST